MSHPSESTAASWRDEAGIDNPAGPLFAGGEFAASDIVSATDISSNVPACQTTECGTTCSGSVGGLCC
jgi:hypothetical protein